MKLEEILTLINAGYTKTEIQSMFLSPAVPDPGAAAAAAPAPVPPAEGKAAAVTVPAEAHAPVAVAVPAAAPAPAPVPAQAQQEVQPTMAELMQSIAKLTSAVQANAIAQSVIPAGAYNPHSAEDMLAEIIRPTLKEVK